METTYHRTQTPIQAMFWSQYINKDLKSFGNAYQSAIIVGYTRETAKRITTKGWFKVGSEMNKRRLLAAAEESLLEALDMDYMEEIVIKGRKTGDYRINNKIMQIRSEIAMFVCDKFWKSL